MFGISQDGNYWIRSSLDAIIYFFRIFATLFLIYFLTLGSREVNAQTFNYTGSVETYAISTEGVYNLTVAGAQGGTSSTANIGGFGALAGGYYTFSSGLALNILVGGA